MSHKLIRTALLSIWFSLAYTFAEAADMGPLDPIIQPFDDEIWSEKVDDSGVQMHNWQGMGYFNYFYVNSSAADWEHRDIKVEVGLLDSDMNSYAGLLYAREGDPSQAIEGMEFRELRNPRTGVVEASIPLPRDWQAYYTETGISMSGPDGIQVLPRRVVTYTAPHNQQAMYLLNTLGMEVLPLVNLSDYVQNHLTPVIDPAFVLTGQYPLPQMIAYWQNMTEGTLLSNLIYDGLGTEWARSDGTRTLIVLSQSIDRRQEFTTWLVFLDQLVAPESVFLQAKTDYLYAIENTRFNPDWRRQKASEMMHRRAEDRQHWANMAQQSAALHRARMDSINSRAASAADIGKTYSEILDINQSGYLDRSAIVASGQSDTVNAIGEYTFINNGATGEQYRVESGSQYYWVNRQAEYLGTDNPLFDPRIDRNFNNEEWTLFNGHK